VLALRRGDMMLPEIGLCTHARHPSAAATALTLALMTAGCNLLGPSASFEGEWSAPGGKTYLMGVSLRQNGDSIHRSVLRPPGRADVLGRDGEPQRDSGARRHSLPAQHDAGLSAALTERDATTTNCRAPAWARP
jgi:hypothetical protein